MPKKKTPPPYWLRGFEEICEGCGGSHARAVEVRCYDCDGPFCPICIVTVEESHLCGKCHEGRK